jgi:hypothetical protein
MLRAALVAIVVAAAWLVSAPPPAPIDGAGRSTSRPDSLFEIPTRGSLSGDDMWLNGVSRLPTLADLPTERHVAFAGDLGEARVALVLGGGTGTALAAWLTGPVGAPAHRMDLAAPVASAEGAGPLALWDTPKAAWMGSVLVVVAMPGDAISFVGGIQVDDFGREAQLRRPLTAVDGVARAAVRSPTANDGADPSSGRVVVAWPPSDVVVTPLLSDRARELAELPVEPADPRSLRAGVDEKQLQGVLHGMVGTYGLRPQQVSPILLAAGPVDESGGAAVLVGATMPSGATVAWLSVSSGDGEPRVGPISTTPEPAGRALLDRVVAVWVMPRTALDEGLRGMLVVSGPRDGTVAEALAADGSTATVTPLIGGAGVASMPADSTVIRILDAHGEVLAQGPVAEPPA